MIERGRRRSPTAGHYGISPARSLFRRTCWHHRLDDADFSAISHSDTSVIRLADIAVTEGVPRRRSASWWPLITRLETRLPAGTPNPKLCGCWRRPVCPSGDARAPVAEEQWPPPPLDWRGAAPRLGLGDRTLLASCYACTAMAPRPAMPQLP